MSAAEAVAYAINRLGHYPENAGANRGDELDELEARFNLKGQPWCAMFATTAAVQGGAPRDVLTASVDQINTWARQGSHGFAKGLLPTAQARPGDLITFGSRHVGFVTRVDPNGTVHTIEGNTTSNKVAVRSHPAGSGTIARPEYPSGGGGGGGGGFLSTAGKIAGLGLAPLAAGETVFKGGEAAAGAVANVGETVADSAKDAVVGVFKDAVGFVGDNAAKAGLYLVFVLGAAALVVLGVVRTTGIQPKIPGAPA